MPCAYMLSCFSPVQFFATLWIVAHQVPLSMGFSKQEYWSGWPFPSPGDLPNPEIEPGSPALQAGSLLSKPPRKYSLSPLLNWKTSYLLFNKLTPKHSGFKQPPSFILWVRNQAGLSWHL